MLKFYTIRKKIYDEVLCECVSVDVTVFYADLQVGEVGELSELL